MFLFSSLCKNYWLFKDISLIPYSICFQGVSEAVLLACGRQFLGAITIFFGYYVVGLPLGFLLTYKLEFGIIGELAAFNFISWFNLHLFYPEINRGP